VVPIRLTANEAPRPDGGPVSLAANDRVAANSEASSAYSTSPEGEQRPVITIHSTDSVKRGKTGSFVLNMTPAMFGGTYVNFSLSGSAIPGVDYVPPLFLAYVGPSGYGVILIQTLPDPRGSSIRRGIRRRGNPGTWRRVCSRSYLAQPECGLSLELAPSRGSRNRALRCPRRAFGAARRSYFWPSLPTRVCGFC